MAQISPHRVLAEAVRAFNEDKAESILSGRVSRDGAAIFLLDPLVSSVSLEVGTGRTYARLHLTKLGRAVRTVLRAVAAASA